MVQSEQKGLYDERFEHDACGIGFVASLKGKKTHDIVKNAIIMLENMEHRGATGFEHNTGDGAGVLFQIPHRFFSDECTKIGVLLPKAGEYGVGMIFFPKDAKMREECRRILNNNLDDMGLSVLGYRDVPCNRYDIGKSSLAEEPKIEQVFVVPKQKMDPDMFERKMYVVRNWTQHVIAKTYPQIKDDFYVVSFSHRNITYKGMLTTHQLRTYYKDLNDERIVSSLAMIHSRFSTNTFPKWKLAQPFRYIAHNGEINTIRGNINWSRSNQTLLESSLFTKDE
ncbi:MAG: glutamate synthase subunit alpha, partial [Bacteroidales bacterium]